MAKDMQNKKRKASVPEAEAEKNKKVKNIDLKATEVSLKKRKATEDATPVTSKKSKAPVEIQPSKKTKNATAIKGGNDEDATTVSIPKKATAATRSKKVNITKQTTEVSEEKPAEETVKDKKATTSKTTFATKEVAEPAKTGEENEEDEVPVVDEIEDEGLEEDDQTMALIKGFESDGDEEDISNEVGFKEGQDTPELPANALTMTKKQQKKLKKIAESGAKEEPGVVYIGRIPHGFYENEMKAYFKQFGNILRLRVSRNKKTGASKHYAFIEFESATVAEIVAKTMDSYLMFGHILKVKSVPAAQVHKDLFKGANKRFKKVPWNKIEGRKLDQGASEQKWDERVEREEQRRGGKAEKMKAIGYEFDAPKVKTTKQITKKDKALTSVTEPKLLEEAVTADITLSLDESNKVVPKGKKGKKTQATEKEAEVVVGVEPVKDQEKEIVDDEGAVATDAAKKTKKGKKSKTTKDSAAVPETVVVDTSSETKGQKSGTGEAAIPEGPVEKELKKKKSEKLLKSKK